ncbi:MAG: type IV pili methyl-accepting chemotaxis transducer N-terminal domain-containing protein [Pseudomonadota bacterium]
MLTKRAFLTALGASGAFVSIKALADGGDPALKISAERKIKLIARERTLVEDIVKDACLVHLGIKPAHYLAKIAYDIEEIEAVIRGVQYGDPARGLLREEDGEVIAALRAANTLWLPFADMAETVLASGTADKATLQAMNEADMPILARFDAVVVELERAYANGTLPLHVVVATKLAVRQTTLTQRIAKEACYITADVDAARMRKKMPELVAQFENTLMALKNGFAPLGIQAPKPALAGAWASVEGEWATFKATVEPVMQGATLDVAALTVVGDQTSRLIEAIEAATELYEATI